MSTTADRYVKPTGLPKLRAALRNTQASASSFVADLEVRPDVVAGLHRTGPRPHRVLMFGGGVLEGRGLRDHNLGLPGRVADQLAARTGRGVDLDVIAESDPTGNGALNGLRGLRLNRYDAVVVVLGERYAEAGVAPTKWEMLFAGLAHVLLGQAASAAPIFVWDAAHVSRPLGLDRHSRAVASHAAALGAISEQTCALTGRIRYRTFARPLQAMEFGSRFAPETYQEWGGDIAGLLYPRLVELDAYLGPDSPRAIRERPDDEGLRQRALESLRIDRSSDALFETVVRQVRAMFRSGHAAINLVDGDRVWQKATTRPEAVDQPREATACAFAINTDDLTLINDTLRDPRTASSPMTQGDRGIRFYAGFPIHSWDGYRIGTLCITDTAPRAMRPADLVTLRDFANRVEQELWMSSLRPRR